MRRACLLAAMSALWTLSCTQYAAEPNEPPAVAEPEPEPEPEVVVRHRSGAQLAWVRANTCEDGAALSLTASDGTGLTLTKLSANAFVEGPIALTELSLSFDNPEPRVREGTFAITLPPGAALSRFAMKIDGRWQEGEVLERQKARQVYEDFLHQRQDPALMEADAGNVFTARVFPIPPQGRKEIVVAYSQTLTGSDEPFRLPVCGLPRLSELDVDVGFADAASAGDIEHLTLHERGFSPTMDLEARPGDQVAGVRAGELAIARVQIRLDTAPASLDGLTILFDTSASRGLDFDGQVHRLGRLVSELARRAPDLPLSVAAFDQSLAKVYEGPASGFGDGELARLRQRGALGASNLARALAGLRKAGLVRPRVLLVGDGVATAGQTERGDLRAIVRRLRDDGVTRLDALVDGGRSDQDMLQGLVTAGLAEDGLVLDARRRLATVVDRLQARTVSGVRVAVPGASWSWPRTLDGVQSGDEVLVYAKLPANAAMTVAMTGATVDDATPTLHPAPAPLVARAHAREKIAELSRRRGEAEDPAKRERLGEQIIALSKEHRVLSDLTALLVLETADDYARYGIERNALADILTVRADGIEVVDRKLPPTPEAELARSVDIPGDPQGLEDEAKKKLDLDGKLSLAVPEPQMKVMLDGDGSDAPSPPPADAGGDAGAFAHAEESERMLRLEQRPRPEPTAAGPRRRTATTGSSSRGSSTRRPASIVANDEAPEAPAPATPVEQRDYAFADDGIEGDIRPGSTEPPSTDPYEGDFGRVMARLADGRTREAAALAQRWHEDNPGDVLALVALGETLEARGDLQQAARAYGSLVDLFPSRADLRRMAGERLERLRGPGQGLAIDTYRKALRQRPDHLSGYRLLAYALLRAGKPEEAFETLAKGLTVRAPDDRYRGVIRVLGEDLRLVGAAWVARAPKARARVEETLKEHGMTLPTQASTRFVLNWETDGNDVDLHVYDDQGGHAYYSSPVMPSGGELYADVTTGYGPECFTIEGTPKADAYTLQAHYYRRGPMGYGMGKLQVITHDGDGTLTFDERPFVIMRDDAFVDLGRIGG